jgi:hypothetical protein
MAKVQQTDNTEILRSSADPPALARAAQELAASDRADTQQTLLAFLKSDEFRRRLDPDGDAVNRADDLWLGKPIRTLQENSSAAALGTLTSLITDKDFIADPDRVDLLITASASMRPVPPALVKFWTDHDPDDSEHQDHVMSALLENGEVPAVAEFERVLLKIVPDPDDGDHRLHLLRQYVVRNRNKIHVLELAERLITQPPRPHWEASIRVAVAEVIFLFKPDWYRPHHVAVPPPWRRTSKAARDEVRRIAERVRASLKIPQELEAGIHATLAELDAMDSKRSSQP